MAEVKLHLYDGISPHSHKLVEITISRVPSLNEHIMAGEEKHWYAVKIVVHYAAGLGDEVLAPEDDGTDADVYAVRIDHHEVLREHRLIP